MIGQPGSGKTFLLAQFAAQGEGLFVNKEERGALAEEENKSHEHFYFVDDAILHHELLLDLVQLRRELDADFSLIACCGWPGDEQFWLRF